MCLTSVSKSSFLSLQIVLETCLFVFNACCFNLIVLLLWWHTSARRHSVRHWCIQQLSVRAQHNASQGSLGSRSSESSMFAYYVRGVICCTWRYILNVNVVLKNNSLTVLKIDSRCVCLHQLCKENSCLIIPLTAYLTYARRSESLLASVDSSNWRLNLQFLIFE